MLINENFAEGILTLHLTRDPTVVMEGDVPIYDAERIPIDNDRFLQFCLTKSSISDYGLCFFFEVSKDLVISRDFIETLYRVIIKIVRTKHRSLVEVPEMPGPDAEGNEAPEEVRMAA